MARDFTIPANQQIWCNAVSSQKTIKLPVDWPEMDDDDFYRRAREDLFPKVKSSAVSLTIISSDPDPKICMELGASILFDKPIIILVADGAMVPANLKRCASAIVVGELSDPETKRQLHEALTSVLENDERSKQSAQ